MRTTPFRIHVPQEAIDDLHERLRRTRWPDEIASAEWDYGTKLSYLQELVAYWKDEFDWTAQEVRLNKLHHYEVDVDGIRIHYIHERGAGVNPFPLILTHGWPGSFVEMEKIITLLIHPGDCGGAPSDSFDVIVPSVPGFAFSERPQSAGMNSRRVAQLWASLMQGLGYQRYGAQGGDIGAAISTWLGYYHPESVLGIHLNFIPGGFNPSVGTEPLTAAEKQYLEAREQWSQREGGYSHIQSTKPQTLAYGLNDSPAGLAAWIVEKYRSWSDCDGDVERRFTKDEMLTNISLYWFSQTIGSSVRFYYEGRSNPASFAGPRP